MADTAAFSILAITVALSLSRPRVGRVKIHHSAAAVFGALLTISAGLVPVDLAFKTIGMLSRPIVTIVGLMIITLIADHAGVFEVVSGWIAKRANGSARRLFGYLFFAGTATGMVFTNDAAVLIFTPLVFNLIEEVSEPGWTLRSKIPFYFAVLYVGNLVGGLVISNPINIIVAGIFDIGFLEYFVWMVIPAVVSIVVSYVGLRWFFRKSLPLSCGSYEPRLAAEGGRLRMICTIVLTMTLAGFFSEGWTGIPVWMVASLGGFVLLVIHSFMSRSGVAPIIRGVGWDVIIFVIGIFIVALGLRSAGLTHTIGRVLETMSGFTAYGLHFATALVAGACSSIMNNHPTAGMMAWVIQDIGAGEIETKMLVYSALIGGDLGPKMLPIGSLAALMWFRILRDRGVDVPYSLYVKIGVPVTLAAIVMSVLALNVEYLLYQLL